VGVLLTFIIMRYLRIDANIVALSGIAIAIGLMIDIGVVYVENIIRHMEMPENKESQKGKPLVSLIFRSMSEVSGAVLTAMLTTVISFLPVFMMEAQEGKLFKPLAYTKTFALISAFLLGITVLPTLAYYFFSWKITSKMVRRAIWYLIIVAGIALFIITGTGIYFGLTLLGINNLLENRWKNRKTANYINIGIAALMIIFFLTTRWLPVGTQAGLSVNFLFVLLVIAFILAVLWLMVIYYEQILRWCLNNKWTFMSVPVLTILFGLVIWLGFGKTFGFVAGSFETVGWKSFRQTAFWQAADQKFPGIGQEFMPSLDEGSFLLMPTTMPHTGIEENLRIIEMLDKRITNIPEVETTVGKWGRVNSALDPAPTQMFENVINYRPEYILNEDGQRVRFKVNRQGEFILTDGSTYNPKAQFRVIPADSLVPHKRGDYFRQWRPEIKNTGDIWQEIVNVSHLPGLTSAPRLQPIEARLVMLSTGMRAPMGVKVSGPDLESIEEGGKIIESALKEVPSVLPSTVFYDRAVGAPYIEIKLDRQKMARYGMTVADLQETISAAVGGMPLTVTVEGRERYPVRLRYPRELRENPEALSALLVSTATGAQIPLADVADIGYSKGAQMIQSENTFLVGYVIFDKTEGKAEVDVVKEADRILKEKIASGEIMLPVGVSYAFAGNYEQQAHAANRLLIVIPISLLLILLILFFQFKTVTASLIHFSGVFVAFAGGFIFLWLYGEPWFLNFSIGGANLRDIFQMHPVNLSIAVWVGFIALFGIATDDGVLMGTYIHSTFIDRNPQTVEEIREAVIYAGMKRVRPAVMTTATTLIALLPVLTSTGKGADIMIPMAIPTFGGMFIQSMTMFVVPVMQYMWRVSVIRRQGKVNE
jgi:Cu(I)/Ag(I) efflux system membrane protein CusA/SilA